ncbi:MAG: hypothetical protein HDR18_03105 [Lachnospiraceae bacterium]|nr:hypothetical protein [Lachnospiraceae bacterium]
MLCNTVSHYPDGVDPMIFFQDISLDKIDIMNTYNQLISQGKYIEANKFISQQKDICGYFADFFNAIENRIYNLQKHLLDKPPKENPFISHKILDTELEELSDELPIEEGMFWI